MLLRETITGQITLLLFEYQSLDSILRTKMSAFKKDRMTTVIVNPNPANTPKKYGMSMGITSTTSPVDILRRDNNNRSLLFNGQFLLIRVSQLTLFVL